MAPALTIGRERYGHWERPHVRRGLLCLGLALAVLAMPLVLPLGGAAALVSSIGMFAMIYAFLPSSYPLLGAFLSLAISCVTFVLGVWAFYD